MAKKGNREGIALQCTECKTIGYITSKNTEEKQEKNKYCKKCNKTTIHKERKVD